MNRIPTLRLIAIFAAYLLSCAVASADPPMHPLNGGVLVPGATGIAQLQRGGPLPGYFQPMEIRAPGSAAISLAVENQFTQPQPAPIEVAMMIGPVYRLRVTNIPQHEGQEVYPTVELINRLYPPMGEELRFPIPIELDQVDLEAALQGKFITRIVYLENPRAAYARGEDPNHQLTVEIAANQDPLVTADRLGRPMAIVRIGGRTPVDIANPDEEFLYHSPPLLRFGRMQHAPVAESKQSAQPQSPSSQPLQEAARSPSNTATSMSYDAPAVDR